MLQIIEGVPQGYKMYIIEPVDCHSKDDNLHSSQFLFNVYWDKVKCERKLNIFEKDPLITCDSLHFFK